ncbi:MAG: hypothetical protein A3J29_16290 [Acidobacteria bacterium RIFCSPLOWO2_12_FULL_67_14b]|nr:MAG: hypothetical protein A3J29_16290 [Acidobacteria bacterium RIFCSPLOWO2_12_FULL_67_14b]
MTTGSTGPTVSDFSIIKQLDSVSPQLFEACCQGRLVPAVQMTLAKKGDRPVEYLKIKLSDCLVSSYQTGGAIPVESVSFSFSDVHISATGPNGQPSEVSCNFGGKGGTEVIGHNHG